MSPKPKTTAEFDALYDVLNKAQKKAVDIIEGPVMVIAGPGTGKTTILTLRIANILKRTDTPPDAILSLTFTESGAYAMRRKLLDIIGPAAYKVHIHTFHGFAEKIIQEYPDYFPRIIGSRIITDAEQIKIIEKIIQSRTIDILRPYGDPSYYVKSVLSEIHILKRENVSPKKLKESIEKDAGKSAGVSKELSATELERLQKRNDKNLELAFVYKKYEEELARKKQYDFDDMLLELIRAMEETPVFKLMLQETFHYILADEHQDANASQNRILELLADFHDSPNLFIVGDDKQAIYRFQGASLENFMYFSKKYPSAAVISLEHNYRSHQGILDASHSVIKNNPSISGHVLTKLVSLQMGTKPIFIDEFPTREDELAYVAVVIERLIKKGEKPEEIAILYRENKNARAVSDMLEAHGIRHRIESDHNILEDIDAVKIVLMCRAINDPSNSELLGQVLLLPEMGCDTADVAEVCNLANRERKPLHEVIKAVLAGNISRQGKITDIAKAYGRIVAWSRQAQTIPFPDFLQQLIQETNMLASIAEAPDSLERLTSLETFFNRIVKAAQSQATFYLKDFIEYIYIVSEHGILSKRTYAEHIGGVRLMTAHRAKGLEFNHVFIVHAVDGLWGNRSHRNHFVIPVIEHARDQGRIEDERRLFYVAMTRARESVTISYGRSNGEKETIQSQFLSEIDPVLISFEKPELAGQPSPFMQKMKTAKYVHPISILHSEFIRSKFLSQPLSVTHINNFIECPWRYFFVNLVRIPQAPTKHQMYGTAIHAALRTYFEAYKEGRTFSAKQVIEVFKHNLDMQPMAIDERTDSFKKGKQALEGYMKTYGSSWNRQVLTEYAIRGVQFKLPHIKKALTHDNEGHTHQHIELTGKIDKIEYIDDVHVTVVDYKTAKPKSRNEIEGKTRSADGNYKRQLVFYKLLLDGDAGGNKGKKLTMKHGEIDFIEPNERGIYKKERFEITAKEVEELSAVIEKIAAAILDLSFTKQGCNDKECSYCKLGKLLLSNESSK